MKISIQKIIQRIKNIGMKEMDKLWKISPCFIGDKKCWCMMVVTIDFTEDDNDDENVIIGAGSINKEVAEHIVFSHNFFIKNLVSKVF